MIKRGPSAGKSKPTQRTQKWLRDHGYLVASAERKMPASARGWRGPLVTQDLFGFIDTLAVNDAHLLAIQSTSGEGGHHAERKRKVLKAPAAPLLAFHMDIEVWSWALRLPGSRNKETGLLIRRKVWTLRREPLTAQLIAKVARDVELKPL
jgi:hypothetical protein